MRALDIDPMIPIAVIAPGIVRETDGRRERIVFTARGHRFAVSLCAGLWTVQRTSLRSGRVTHATFWSPTRMAHHYRGPARAAFKTIIAAALA
jgi:hypothetical protein